MQTFSIDLTEQRLTIKRSRSKDIVWCVGITASLIGFICVFFGPLPNHFKLPVELKFALFPFAAALLFWLGRSFFFLFRQELIFDRVLGQVIVNRHPVHSMAELQSVCLERSYYREGMNWKLFLKMKSRVKTEIASDNDFGVSERELRSLGGTIATYAVIDFITPEEFISAASRRLICASQPKKWRGKGFRKRLAQQRQARNGPVKR